MQVNKGKKEKEKENVGLSLDGAETKEKAKVHKTSLASAVTGKTSIRES